MVEHIVQPEDVMEQYVLCVKVYILIEKIKLRLQKLKIIFLQSIIWICKTDVRKQFINQIF